MMILFEIKMLDFINLVLRNRMLLSHLAIFSYLFPQDETTG